MIVHFNDSDPAMLPAPSQDKTGPQLDFAAIFAAMRRNKRIMFLSVLIAVGIGAVHVQTSPRSYLAATEVMIIEEFAGSAQNFNRPATLAQNEITLDSARKVLESQKLALAVVDMLDLHARPEMLSNESSLARQGIDNVRGLILGLLPAEQAAPAQIDPETADQLARMSAADTLRQGIEVRREGRSSVFSIRYTSNNPQFAAEVVNAYGQAFLADQLIGNVEASSSVLDWLHDRLMVIQENSAQAALKAEEFRARNGLLTVAGESIRVQTISQLNADLAAATVELAQIRALKTVYAELRELDPIEFVRSGAAGVRVPAAEFAAGQQRLLDLQQSLDDVERRQGPGHSAAIRLRAQIEREGNTLQREIASLYETTRNAARVKEAEVEMLRASIEDFSNENLQLATARVELQSLERQAGILDALNETYLMRMKDLEQTQTFPVANVRVLSVSDVPEKPVAPRKTIIMGFMLLMGTMVGGGLSVLRDGREKVIRTSDALYDASGRPFLGYLPMLTLNEVKALPEPQEAKARPVLPRYNRLRKSGTCQQPDPFRYPFPALKHPRSHYTETLRNIRNACETSALGKSGYVLGVVSLRPGEGKTTLAQNLAALTAVSGSSVLLVDGDVRTSGMSQRLGQSEGVGLRDVLQGTAAMHNAIRKETSTGLHFMSSGFSPDDAHAGDSLYSSRFRDMLDEARSRYALTIVDLAPLGPVSDARALLPAIDGLVMVVEWGRMPIGLLQKTLSMDPVLYKKILGITLSKTNMTSLRDYTRLDETGNYYDVYASKHA